jgi:hypothetical protein
MSHDCRQKQWHDGRAQAGRPRPISLGGEYCYAAAMNRRRGTLIALSSGRAVRRRWIWQDATALGTPTVSMRRQVNVQEGWNAFFVPHDGHPNVRLARLRAGAQLMQDL